MVRLAGVTGFRPLGAVLLAIVSAGVLGLSSMLTSAFAFGVENVERFIADIALLADEGWIMSGTGLPDPTVGPYLDLVTAHYLQPPSPLFDGQPTFPTYTFDGLTTPEQFCPIVCLPPPNPNLTFGDSVAQGVDILHGKIVPALQAGNNVAVLGTSQSATIASQEMNNLINNLPTGLTRDDLSNLHVVLIGDPNNPIGGILTRLQFPDGVQAFSLESAPQHLPFLNVPLSMAPTPTGPFPTDIYTGEYDGWANFPQDPTNLLAVINAILGIQMVHGNYFDHLANAVNVGSIGDTTFYMIPYQLPILSPIYQLGDFGKVVGDAIAPGLKLGIDWAYGNPGDPGAGIPIDGVDPIGAAGPWAVTATGHLSDSSGVAGFLPMMGPLQMLAGMQLASVQSLVNPINDILGFAGQNPLPDSVIDSLLAGYHFTNQVDAFVLTGWNALATQLDLLGPDAIFDGAPLISAQPLLDLIGVGFDIFNFFGA